jgi:hypothetical protein
MTDPLLNLMGLSFMLGILILWFLTMWIIASLFQGNIKRKIRTFLSAIFIIFLISLIAFFYGISLQIQIVFWLAFVLIVVVLIFFK